MDEYWHRLRNLKVDGDGKTTMVPFHWVRREKDHQDSETDKTFLGSFNLFSILTRAWYWTGKESLHVTSVSQWPWLYHWRLCKMPGEKRYWPGKEIIHVTSIAQWTWPYRWLLYVKRKRKSKTGWTRWMPLRLLASLRLSSFCAVDRAFVTLSSCRQSRVYELLCAIDWTLATLSSCLCFACLLPALCNDRYHKTLWLTLVHFMRLWRVWVSRLRRLDLSPTTKDWTHWMSWKCLPMMR